MKHVKLFEEFKEKTLKHDLKPGKDLDNELRYTRVGKKLKKHTSIGMYVNRDELLTVIHYLKKLGYESLHEEEDERKLINDNSEFAIQWDGKDRFYHLDQARKFDLKDAVEIISKFDDYFAFKPEYRGHNLKKFGV